VYLCYSGFIRLFCALLPYAEDMVGEVIVPPARKLEDLIRLADLCVDLLRQNEEFYAEVSQHSVLVFVTSIQRACADIPPWSALAQKLAQQSYPLFQCSALAQNYLRAATMCRIVVQNALAHEERTTRKPRFSKVRLRRNKVIALSRN
jgi:hypothetical protein